MEDFAKETGVYMIRCDFGINEEEMLKEKVCDFLKKLERYRTMVAYKPIHELLQTILTENNYLLYVSTMPAGEQRKANVEMLLEKAAAFEQTSYYGLFHFIRYIEQMEKYDMVKEEVIPQSESTIRKYQKQHLFTDTGIEIKIPMDQYKDSKNVEFITNPDGTVSLLIKNIEHLEARY